MEQKPFFMVFVEGEHSPTYKHACIENAELEAKRLTDLTKKPSYVLASIKSINLPEKFIVTDIRPKGEELPF
jgi:hypothetical protein